MPSPLPGMNPYLEQSELWSEFHSRMIVAIADALDDVLSREYRVAVEKRVYLAQNDDAVLIGIPDVTGTGAERAPTMAVSTTAVTAPLTVEVPLLEEVQERYLEIREGATGKVITTIELLAPKNKRAGEGRDTYLKKRQKILGSASHLVEIDLLRSGLPMPVIGEVASYYRILISRSDQRPKAQLAFNLRQPIPPFAVPLRLGEAEPVIDLQPLLHRVYDRARFELAIDMRRSPNPKLNREDWHWLQAIVGLGYTDRRNP